MPQDRGWGRKRLVPPKTKCPQCGEPVRRVWADFNRPMYVEVQSRKYGPIIVSSIQYGKYRVMRRQADLFGETSTSWGYDIHDCKLSRLMKGETW